MTKMMLTEFEKSKEEMKKIRGEWESSKQRAKEEMMVERSVVKVFDTPSPQSCWEITTPVVSKALVDEEEKTEYSPCFVGKESIN